MFRLARSILQRGASSTPPTPHRRTFVGWLLYVGRFYVFGLCSYKLIGHYLVFPGSTQGESMFPTIPSELSVAFISRLHRKGRKLRIGDIVYSRAPHFPQQLVGKRIIGMPGDYILKDPHLAPTPGGAYLPPIVPDEGQRSEPIMIQVPEGHVWLSGDNLSRSNDSRFYGPVPMALLEGKILYSGDGWFSWTSFREDQLTPVEVLE